MKKIINGLDSFEKVIGGILVGILFIILIWQTVSRNIGIKATWTDETARYLFVLLTYIGAGLAMLLGKYIKIDILVYIWPKKIRKYMEAMGSVVAMLFCIFVCYQTVVYNINVVAGAGRMSPSLGLPMSIPYTAVSIGYFLMGVRLLQVEVLPKIRNLFRKEKTEGGEV